MTIILNFLKRFKRKIKAKTAEHQLPLFESESIAKAGKPVAKLVPFVEKITERELGLLKGKIELRDDIDESLPEEIIEEFST